MIRLVDKPTNRSYESYSSNNNNSLWIQTEKEARETKTKASLRSLPSFPSFYPVPYCLPSLRFLLNCFLFIPLSSLFSFLSSIFSNPSLYLIYFPSSPTNLLFQPYLLYFFPPVFPTIPSYLFPFFLAFCTHPLASP